MLVLFLIGTVHALLIWDGDILVQYAMLGVLLIPLHRLPARGVLLVALLLLALQFVGPRVQGALRTWRSTPERVQVRELAEGVRQEDFGVQGNLGLRAEEDGSWRDNTAYRWDKYSRKMNGYSQPVRVLADPILLLFVIGLYVGRLRLLEGTDSRRGGLALVTAGAAVLTLVANLLLRWFPEVGADAEEALTMADNWGVTAFYVAGLTLLMSRAGSVPKKLSLLAPVGRMGLTNYLLQSLVMTFLFFPYALGIPDFGATATLLVSVAFFFLVQMPLSHWWLARYQFGPAEWLWRSLTYGYPQPMRRMESVPGAALQPGQVRAGVA